MITAIFINDYFDAGIKLGLEAMIYELDGKKPKMRDENYWIASNATVIGDVFLDTNASIWFNCVVRGDNEPISIGKGSNIQEGSIIHTDPGLNAQLVIMLL
jgi:carbonic anhydrase/acetyltransferase-like protein (isoleucine patch superfamily)